MGHILKIRKEQVRIHEIIRLIIMKMKIKIKNRSHRYYINSSLYHSRHGHKYSEYKKCLSIMMRIYIKQT